MLREARYLDQDHIVCNGNRPECKYDSKISTPYMINTEALLAHAFL